MNASANRRNRSALTVLRGAPLELTNREARAVLDLLDTLRASLQRRLPITVELVELDVELRRRFVEVADQSPARVAAGQSRGRAR